MHSASLALEVVAATAASASGTAAVAAAGEVGDWEPTAPLVGVGPRAVLIAAAIPPAGVQPSPNSASKG